MLCFLLCSLLLLVGGGGGLLFYDFRYKRSTILEERAKLLFRLFRLWKRSTV